MANNALPIRKRKAPAPAPAPVAVAPKPLMFGFIGLGNMGSAIAQRLLNAGHLVMVWNRTHTKCKPFKKYGAEVAKTLQELVTSVDIVLVCISNQQAVQELALGKTAIEAYMKSGQGYVEMTGVDDESSIKVAKAMEAKGVRYLEAMLHGYRQDVVAGSMVVFASGDKSLFKETRTCFTSFAKKAVFLNQDVGYAAKLYVTVQTISATMLTGLAEAMTLAHRSGLQLKSLMDVLELTEMMSPMMKSKGWAIISNDYKSNDTSKNLMKDVKLALEMSNDLEFPLYASATVHEVLKESVKNGFGEQDTCAIYKLNQL